MADRSSLGTRGPRTGTSLREGLQYRGGVGQWAWILHRAAGLGVLLFLVLHIVDVFLAAFGPSVFNKLLFIYHGPVFKPLILLLVFGVVYHAFNGLRLVLIDLWPRTTAIQRELWYGAMAISLGVTLVSILALL